MLLISCILGLVEGLTEFLPVSSTLHLILVSDFLGFIGNDKEKIFNVIIQLGSILSVVVCFWKKFVFLIISGVYSSYFSKSCLCIGHIVIGILPVMFFGWIFYEQIKNIFELKYMVYALIAGGFFLLFSELFSHKKDDCVSNINDLTYLQAFLIGCFQCLALWPGFSRSGATIGGGLLIGVSKYVSVIFSFLLAVPVMLSATALVLYKNFYIFMQQDFLFLCVGFCSAFIFSLLTIRIFIKIIQYVSFIPFAIYRFVLAGLVYLLYI